MDYYCIDRRVLFTGFAITVATVEQLPLDAKLLV